MNNYFYHYQFPQEPLRFEPNHLDNLLLHCSKINASDITIQTNEPVFVEIYGKLYKTAGFFICAILAVLLFLISWRLSYVSENRIIERMI